MYRCLSSKYFFWDPEYAFLSPGRFSALKEIDWVLDALAAGATSLQYYYMGYYIHTCPKMRYKAEYHPSELLCPEQYVWVTINGSVLNALEASAYVVFSQVPGVSIQPRTARIFAQSSSTAAVQGNELSYPQQQQEQCLVSCSSGVHADTAHTGSTCTQAAQQAGRQHMSNGVEPQQAPPLPAIDTHQQLVLTEAEVNNQMTFIMKQPMRWNIIKQSGVLDWDELQALEAQIKEWMMLVGQTARQLIYLLPQLAFAAA